MNFDAFMRFRSFHSRGNLAENSSFKRSSFQGSEHEDQPIVAVKNERLVDFTQRSAYTAEAHARLASGLAVEQIVQFVARLVVI